MKKASESRILALTKDNPNRRWMQLVEFPDFSLVVRTGFVGGNDRRFAVLKLRCNLGQWLYNRFLFLFLLFSFGLHLRSGTGGTHNRSDISCNTLLYGCFLIALNKSISDFIGKQ